MTSQCSGCLSLENSCIRRIECCKPATDLCWECQNNNGIILRTVKCSEEEKAARLLRQQTHIEHVCAERALYREQVAAAKLVAVDLRLGENHPRSRPVTMHYSFDFAQQVHYPCNPLQPGPVYFLMPKINYLIDEIYEKIRRTWHRLREETAQWWRDGSQPSARSQLPSLCSAYSRTTTWSVTTAPVVPPRRDPGILRPSLCRSDLSETRSGEAWPEYCYQWANNCHMSASTTTTDNIWTQTALFRANHSIPIKHIHFVSRQSPFEIGAVIIITVALHNVM